MKKNHKEEEKGKEKKKAKEGGEAEGGRSQIEKGTGGQGVA